MHYTIEDRAQVKALMATGLGAPIISRQLGIPERTVSHMMMRLREIAAEQGDKELLDRDYATSMRADELIHDGMDWVASDDTGERAGKSLIALNAIRGTAIDKILKRREVASPNIQVNVLIAERAEQLRNQLTTINTTLTDAP